MKKINIRTHSRKLLADIITPVSIYLRIRDVFPNSILLESSDYRGNENSYSFICMKPVAGIQVEEGTITELYPDGSKITTGITDDKTFNLRFSEFSGAFVNSEPAYDIPVNGFFGYISFDAIRYFEKVRFKNPSDHPQRIPDIRYHIYKYVIAINHYLNTLQITENIFDGDNEGIDGIESLLKSRNIAIYPFRCDRREEQNMSDSEYMDMVTRGKEQCHKGNVFQVVLSRQFSRKFKGDEFSVYRALRSVNPSPYLFFFDYGGYKIFGSSPEAHLKIQNGKAYINPIAGTIRRTGNDENDKLLAQQLADDPKENSEHVMLVDLARNDLSRHAINVKVENFREVQFYSHVIHLVSAVSGELKKNTSVAEMISATFPAGTLSGAPKIMAMKIIDELENQRRGFYGGAIGYLDFNGNFNHAIMIRTFLSKANTLYYQAGAGIVAVSDKEKELQEVNNKLGALRTAIDLAEEIK